MLKICLFKEAEKVVRVIKYLKIREILEQIPKDNPGLSDCAIGG